MPGSRIRARGAAPATVGAAGCNRMCCKLQQDATRLQSYATQAAIVSVEGCNRMQPRLQPYVLQAATLRIAGCNCAYPRASSDAGGKSVLSSSS